MAMDPALIVGMLAVVGTAIAAYFAFLAVPRPAIQVLRFQMTVDVVRRRSTFQAQLKNVGTTAAKVRIQSLGHPIETGMPEYRGEQYFPGSRWHRVLPGDVWGVNASFPLDDPEGSLAGRFEIDGEFAFRFQPSFVGGSLFGERVLLKYRCATQEAMKPPFPREYYATSCARE